jgi:adenylate cyclase
MLFSDLEGFTTISESMLPQEVVKLLNEYLNEMSQVIFRYGGTIDKYEGDLIMAIFGAPVPQTDHAVRACLTALAMQERLAEMRELWKREGKPPLKARIGINTGPVVVGNMGSSIKFNYTVIGDAVNLASRLEGENKEYGTSIMIGESTYRVVKEAIETRYLGEVVVKGKTVPVKVYEVTGRRDKEIRG